MKSLTLALLAAVSLSGQDPREIVRHSTERDWTDFESRKDYLYQQRQEFREYTKDGTLGARRSEAREIVIVAALPAADRPR